MIHSETKMKPEGIELKSFINDLHHKNMQNKEIVKAIMHSDWLLPDLMKGARKNNAVNIVKSGLRSLVSEILKRPAGDTRQADLFGIDKELMRTAVEIGDTKFTVPNDLMGFDLVALNKFSMSKEGARQLWRSIKFYKLKAKETDLKADRMYVHFTEVLRVKGWTHAEIVGH